MTTDENGHDTYEGDWNSMCGVNPDASNGLRVMSAMALEIAADVLRGDGKKWTERDVLLARGAIAGMRMQMAEGFDPAARYLTELCDVCIYG
jgi:hypothetical protein